MTKAMPWSVELLITEVAAMKNDTVKKLKSMRLPAFAEAYEKQIDQEAEYGSMSFHERLMLLVDAEYDSRHNNNIKRLIKNAKFSDSSAFLGNIDYLPDRHLNRDLLESLADNDYIRQGLNVILIRLQVPAKALLLMHWESTPANPDIRPDISVCRNCSANWKQRGYRENIIK